MRQITRLRILTVTPIAQPFRVEIGHTKIHQAGFGGHLAIAITETLAVRTIDQVSAQIETTDGPDVKTIDAIEQLIGTRERTDRFQIAFDEQGFEIARRGRTSAVPRQWRSESHGS